MQTQQAKRKILNDKIKKVRRHKLESARVKTASLQITGRREAFVLQRTWNRLVAVIMKEVHCVRRQSCDGCIA